MGSKWNIRKCENCGRRYQPIRNEQRYCHSRCRMAAFLVRRQEKPCSHCGHRQAANG